MDKQLPIIAYEFHNYSTGHCYVDYVPKPAMEAGYIKIPLVSVERLNIEVEKAQDELIEKIRVNVGMYEMNSHELENWLKSLKL